MYNNDMNLISIPKKLGFIQTLIFKERLTTNLTKLTISAIIPLVSGVFVIVYI